MVTYGDYFSRRVLHNCGVSPNKTMLDKEDSAYKDMQRTDNIRSKMSEIYQTLYHGYAEKNVAATKENFDELQIERKIVSAFYDSGVLSNAERDYFQTQSFQVVNEREKISVEEANLSNDSIRAQKVDVKVNTPVMRKM